MIDSARIADPIERCQARYAEVESECRQKGLDRIEIEKSLASCVRYAHGRAWLKARAYRPTGVALGCPLPDLAYQEVLWKLCEHTDQRLRLLTGINRPSFAIVPPDCFHVTLVNYDHFGMKADNASVRHFRSSQKPAVETIMAEQQCGPVTLKCNGLLLSPHGRLMVCGFAQDRRVFELKEALRSKLQFLRINFPLMTHIKIGHVLVHLDQRQSQEFMEWLTGENHKITRSLRFEDAYTPQGRIPL